MEYKFLKSGNLLIFIDKEEQQELISWKNEEGSDFYSDAFMRDFFEEFLANSEFQWCAPEWIGALTNAPILAIFGKDRPIRDDENEEYCNLVGYDGTTTYVQDAEEVYAFMDYQVISPQEILLKYGEVIFQKGN